LEFRLQAAILCAAEKPPEDGTPNKKFKLSCNKSIMTL